MIASVLWKEYREHRAVWLVLAALAAGVLVGLPTAFPEDIVRLQGHREVFVATGALFAWLYGMVCGAMMLAGEREAGTQPFLDTLPGTRLRLWRAKCLAGSLFVVGHALAVGGLMMVEPEPVFDRGTWPRVGALLAAAAAVGFSWGLLLSARARSVLGAIGMAIAAQAVCLPVLCWLSLAAEVAVAHLLGVGVFGEMVLFPAAVACLALPLAASADAYGRVDRLRRSAAQGTEAPRAAARRGFRASLWLAGRQVRGAAVWVLVAGLAGGLLVPNYPLAFWPLVTLALGAICGVTAFTDEQSGGRRFLGDQRLPPGPVWLAKVGLLLGLLVATLALLSLPSLALLAIDQGTRAHEATSGQTVSGRVFRSVLIGTTVPAGAFFFAPALYGFAAGVLSGQLFRKAVVAVFVAAGVGVLLLGPWVPGLLAGGVSSWQVLLPPALLLAASRLLVRPWAAERMGSRGVVGGLAALTGLCLATLTLGVWYRVASVPDTPEPADLEELLARLPDPEHNEAGRLVGGVLATVDGHRAAWNATKPTRPLFPPDRDAPGANDPSFLAEATEVVARGWPEGPTEKAELAGWLDRVFAEAVWAKLARLPSLPTGVVTDPRRLQVHSAFRHLDATHPATALLMARGLAEQVKGDPAPFVKHLDTALALARNLENGAPELSAAMAAWVERTALGALDHWLARLSGRPDLLRAAGEVLDRHRAARPGVLLDTRLSEYLLARNSLDDPPSWLENVAPAENAAPRGPSDAALLTAVFQVPWERERQRRLLRTGFFAPQGLDPSVLPYARLAVPIGRELSSRSGTDRDRARRRRAHLEAARLAVALRHHQATAGRPAGRLDQLVPGSLVAVPADPYDGKPFRYRLSAGEEMVDPLAGGAAGGPPGLRRVAPGQAVLWSVGRDGRDDGGRDPGSDLIFVVPLPRGR